MADASKQTAATVIATADDGIAVIRINRPERANSLDPETVALLTTEILDAESNAAVKAVILTGTGDAVFCAGADIKAAADGGRIGPDPARRGLFEIVHELKKPTIAAINGSAAGGGFELALACDLRVVVETAKLVLPEARRGMGAQFATVMLPRLLPPALAFEMLYTGEPFTSARLAAHGLFNRVVPAGQALDAALALARQIARNAPLSLGRMKRTIVRAAGMAPAAALRLEEGPSPYDSEDRVEGFRAFLEKREPRWSGR